MRKKTQNSACCLVFILPYLSSNRNSQFILKIFCFLLKVHIQIPQKFFPPQLRKVWKTFGGFAIMEKNKNNIF